MTAPRLALESHNEGILLLNEVNVGTQGEDKQMRSITAVTMPFRLKVGIVLQGECIAALSALRRL